MEQQPIPQDPRLIPLTQGIVVTVDGSDCEWLSQWKWYAHLDGRTFYAQWSDGLDGGKQKTEMREWLAQIMAGCKQKYLGLFGKGERKCLGLFATPEEAAVATASAMSPQ